MKEKIEKKHKSNQKQEETTLTDEITAVLEEIQKPTKQKQKGEIVTITAENQVMIGEREYLLVSNHREAFDEQRLGERFSDILSKYDYIVGDWGNDQLRLKGFFRTKNRKAAPDQRIDTLEEYLYEYCNFGCAYFVLKRIGNIPEQQPFRKKKNNRKYTDQKKGTNIQTQSSKTKEGTTTKKRKPKKEKIITHEYDATKKPSFKIRKREE